jgi:hypothetical protein
LPVPGFLTAPALLAKKSYLLDLILFHAIAGVNIFHGGSRTL